MTDLRAGHRWPLLAAGGCGLLAAGLAIGYQLRPDALPSTDGVLVGAAPAAPVRDEHGVHAAPATTGSEVVVTLTPDLVARAGIVTALPAEGLSASFLRMPGVVEPNAYKEVAVTSLVSGRVVQVRGELGQRVAAGEPLATIYSPEIADAQSAFIVARADQVAHAQRQVGTQRLAAIGAVSREEFELLEAERAMHDASVEKARARLALLGIPEERVQRLAGSQDVLTTVDVRAPLAGVISRRAANPGLNIDPSTPLFTVVDLSTVWVIADLYERDFAKARVGSQATVTSASYPDLTLRGQVRYIDPQLQPETRTAKLRVEVPNPANQLRFGMFVDVRIGESERAALLVPRAALQAVGARSVVYVAQSDGGRFVERKVEVGAASGDLVPVLAGLEAGERVVTGGVFFVRAEAERLRGNQP